MFRYNGSGGGLFLFLILIAFPGVSFAVEPLQVRLGFDGEFIGSHALHLEDKTRELDIGDIRSPTHQSRFAPDNQATLNFGFSDAAEWLYIPVKNPGVDQVRWLLQLEEPRINRAELYEVMPDGKYVAHLAGNQVPVGERDMKHRQSVFSLTSPPGDSALYIRVISPGKTMTNLYATAWDEKKFTERNYLGNLLLGVFYGSMLGLLLYNLFLLITVRDASYLWYLLYLSSAIFTYLSINGLGSVFLWGDSAYLGGESAIIGYFVSFFFIFIFARVFLNTRQLSLQLDRLVVGGAAFAGICGLISISDLSFTFNWAYAYPLSFPFPVILLYVGIVSLRKGVRQSRYYVAAWSIFLLSLPAFFLKDIGVLPNSLANTYSIQLGTFLEAILLSLALADRINILREEKEKAEAGMLSVLQRSRDELEVKVTERTSQLQEKTELLNQANKEMTQEINQRKVLEEELRKLATTDFLTGLFSRRQLFELGEKEISRARRNSAPLSLLLLDIDHFKAVNDTYGHAVGDEVLKNFATIFRGALRNVDIVCRFGGEEFVAILPDTDTELAMEVAQRLRQNVEASRFSLNGVDVKYTISIGLATFQKKDTAINQLINRADGALYRAKESGRNRVVLAGQPSSAEDC